MPSLVPFTLKPQILVRLSLLTIGSFLILIVAREFTISDNGDFGRYGLHCYFEHPVGMAYWVDHESPEFLRRFFASPNIYWVAAQNSDCSQSWPSSAHILWGAGYYFNKIFFSSSVLNLRYVALPFFLIQFLLLVAAVRYPSVSGMEIVGAIALLPLFSDAVILSYYTSFYAESIAILTIFALTAFVICARGWLPSAELPAETLFICFFVAASFLIGLSKPQYVYVLPVAAIVIGCSSALQRHWLIRIMAVFGILALLAGTFLQHFRQDQVHQKVNAYISLYTGILMFSEDRQVLLNKLGLPQESASLIGQNAFTPEALQFIDGHPSLSQALFLRAVLVDPTAFARLIVHNTGELGQAKLTFGTVPGSAYGSPPWYLSLFSNIRVVALLLIAGLSIPCAILLRKHLGRRAIATLGFLVAIVPIDILVSSFAGVMEAKRHLVLSSVSGAVLTGFVIVSVTSVLEAFRQSLKLHVPT